MQSILTTTTNILCVNNLLNEGKSEINPKAYPKQAEDLVFVENQLDHGGIIVNVWNQHLIEK